MSAPDPDPAGQAKSRTLRTHFARAFFFLTLCAVLYLALMPNYGHARFRLVSLPFYRWIADHDNLDNIVAFAVLATATFLLGRHPASVENRGLRAAFARRFASRTVRLAGLLAMVCLFEILQIWIPGRTSSLEDVCTGWSGIFAAWLLCELRDSRATQS